MLNQKAIEEKILAKIEDVGQALIFWIGAFFGLKKFKPEIDSVLAFGEHAGKMTARSAWRLLNHNLVVVLRSLYRTTLALQVVFGFLSLIPLVMLYYAKMIAVSIGLMLVIAFVAWMRLRRLKGVFAFKSLDALTADPSAVASFGPSDRFSVVDLALFPALLAGQGLVTILIAAFTGTAYNTSMVFIWPMMFIGALTMMIGFQASRLTLYILLLLVEGPAEWAERATGQLVKAILDPALLGINASNVDELLPDSLVNEMKRAIEKLYGVLDQTNHLMMPLILIMAVSGNLWLTGLCVFGLFLFGWRQSSRFKLGGEYAKQAKIDIERAERFLYELTVLIFIVHIVLLLFFGLHAIPATTSSIGVLIMMGWDVLTLNLLLSIATVAVIYWVARWLYAPKKDTVLLTLSRVTAIILICLGVVISAINIAALAGVSVRPQASYFQRYESPSSEAWHCLNGMQDFDESSADHGPSCGPFRRDYRTPTAGRSIGASTPLEVAPTQDGSVVDQFLCWSWLEWHCPQPPPSQEPASNAAPAATPIAAPDSTPASAQRQNVDTSRMVASLSAHVASNGSLPPTPFDDIIERASRQYNVDKFLIRAVIRQESNFNPNALGGVGEKGLMQLKPSTARSLGVSDGFDPEENIFGGTRYIRRNLDRCFQDIRCALASYNGGYRGRHGFKAQRYAGRVMARYTAYRNGTAVESAPSRNHRAPRIESSDSVLVERETTRDSSRVTVARLDDNVCDELPEYFLGRMRSQGRCR